MCPLAHASHTLCSYLWSLVAALLTVRLPVRAAFSPQNGSQGQRFWPPRQSALLPVSASECLSLRMHGRRCLVVCRDASVCFHFTWARSSNQRAMLMLRTLSLCTRQHSARLARSAALARVSLALRQSSEKSYKRAHAASVQDLDAFWMKEAHERLTWITKPSVCQQHNLAAGDISWFKDGSLNASGERRRGRRRGIGDADAGGGEKKEKRGRCGSANSAVA